MKLAIFVERSNCTSCGLLGVSSIMSFFSWSGGITPHGEFSFQAMVHLKFSNPKPVIFKTECSGGLWEVISRPGGSEGGAEWERQAWGSA